MYFKTRKRLENEVQEKRQLIKNVMGIVNYIHIGSQSNSVRNNLNCISLLKNLIDGFKCFKNPVCIM